MVIYGIICFLLLLMSPLLALLAQVGTLSLEWGWITSFFDIMGFVFFLVGLYLYGILLKHYLHD